MTPENLNLLVSELRRDEGVRYLPYKDSVGINSTGVGHNLKEIPLKEGWSYPLTDTQVNELLESDLKNVFCDLENNISWWSNLSEVRQRVLANMCFNLGINRLLGFKNTLNFIKNGQYDDAAEGMLNSKWASQVKDRAKRLATMMKEG